jgi:hypothetical protein
MTIHWKALEENFLMATLVIWFNHFQGKKAFSEFFSKNLSQGYDFFCQCHQLGYRLTFLGGVKHIMVGSLAEVPTELFLTKVCNRSALFQGLQESYPGHPSDLCKCMDSNVRNSTCRWRGRTPSATLTWSGLGHGIISGSLDVSCFLSNWKIWIRRFNERTGLLHINYWMTDGDFCHRGRDTQIAQKS